MPSKVIAAACLFLVAGVLIFISALPWGTEKIIHVVERQQSPPEALTLLPWDASVTRLIARQMYLLGPYQPARIQHFFESSIRHRPLYAPTWVDLAQSLAREGREIEAQRYLHIAQKLWPTRARLLWRIAMSEILMGYNDRALGTLGSYLTVQPGRAIQVLTVAKRIQPQPKKLLDTLLATVSKDREDIDLIYARVLVGALRLRDAPLAKAAWTLAPRSVQRDSKIVLPYIQLFINHSDSDTARSAWATLTGTSAVANIFNPSFEQSFVNGGFGWRVRKSPGVTAKRDCQIYYHGACSLLAQFQGTNNVSFDHVAQTIPVIPGETYRLRGYWRGVDITTRSGVFLDALSKGARRAYSKIPEKTKSWNWQPFELTITIPMDSYFLHVRIRRQKTDALDRNISGSVWFDAFSLEPVAG